MHYDRFHGDPPLDRVLRDYFPDFGYRGVMLDVGAGDPVLISNSYHFERNGWSVACVEPNPIYANRLRHERDLVLEYACSNEDVDDALFTVMISPALRTMMSGSGLVVRLDPAFGHPPDLRVAAQIWVKTRTLDHLVEAYLPGVRTIDILSIDVEGHEMPVLEGFTLDRWRPQIVVVENFCPEWGCEEYMCAEGYRREHRIAGNDVYRREV